MSAGADNAGGGSARLLHYHESMTAPEELFCTYALGGELTRGARSLAPDPVRSRLSGGVQLLPRLASDSLDSAVHGSHRSTCRFDPRLRPTRVSHNVTGNENDSDWQQRLRTRTRTVEAIKAKPEYRFALLAAERPPTPDPSDRSILKRAWEANVQAWRKDLQGTVVSF
jgi:hypothetical protein